MDHQTTTTDYQMTEKQLLVKVHHLPLHLKTGWMRMSDQGSITEADISTDITARRTDRTTDITARRTDRTKNLTRRSL
jgi:hypothetical protein